jgi:phosphoribosylglycinamide formyltransferase 1
MYKKETRIALFISGRGTTAQMIIQACKERRIGARPVLVVSSDPQAPGIQKVLSEGLAKEDVLVISPRQYINKEVFGNAIVNACRARRVDIFLQCGWMVKTPSNVVAAYPGLNEHPGPLDPGKPDFGGKGMFGRRVHHARLLFVRDKDPQHWWTEATVQQVAKDYDKGAVVGRRRVPIFSKDDTNTLAQRVLLEEHALQIWALNQIVQGKLRALPSRNDVLVKPDEVPFLEWAKQEAIKKFPNG